VTGVSTRTADERPPTDPGPPVPAEGSRSATAVGFAVVLVGTVLATLLAARRTGAAAAGAGEADLAALVGAVRLPDAGVVATALPDLLTARQLAALVAVLPVADGVLDGARVAALVCGALAALLVWPVLRAFGTGPAVTAAGVALAGIAPPALALHGLVSTGAPAAVWLGLAAALAVGGRPAAGLAAALVATATAPIAGAAVLALLVHLVLDGTVRVPDRARVPAGVAAAVLVGVLAGVATGPWAGRGAVLPPVAAAVGALVAAVVLLVAARRLSWLRPVLTPTAVLTAAALLPTPTGAAAALLALPAVAVVAALLIADLGRAAAVGVATVVATAAALVAAAVVVPTGPAGPGSVVGWIAAELPAATPVRADPLDRIELLAAGLPPQRLVGAQRGAQGGAQDGAVDLVTARGGGDPGPCAVALAAGPGSGGGRSAVCPSRPQDPAEESDRERLGGELAGNPALVLAPEASDLLRRGAVDRRVAVVLVALTRAREVRVDAFPETPLDAPGAPRRRLLVGGLDGAEGEESRRLLESFLRGQQPPFAPARTEAVPGGLLVTWAAAA
jgi:hypothetical protein